MRGPAHVGKESVAKGEGARQFPIIRRLRFGVRALRFDRRCAKRGERVSVLMRRVLRQRVGTEIARRLAVRVGKSREQAIKGVILLNEDDDVTNRIDARGSWLRARG